MISPKAVAELIAGFASQEHTGDVWMYALDEANRLGVAHLLRRYEDPSYGEEYLVTQDEANDMGVNWGELRRID